MVFYEDSNELRVKNGKAQLTQVIIYIMNNPCVRDEVSYSNLFSDLSLSSIGPK